MTILDRYTWDQAAIAGLATAQGFKAIGLTADTIRQWAHRGHVKAVGKAPGGAHLYRIADVAKHTERKTA